MFLFKTKMLNSRFRSQNYPGTQPKKAQSWKESRLDLPHTTTYWGPQSNVGVVEIAFPFSFSLLLKLTNELRIVTLEPPFCSFYGSMLNRVIPVRTTHEARYSKKKARSSASRSASLNRSAVPARLLSAMSSLLFSFAWLRKALVIPEVYFLFDRG